MIKSTGYFMILSTGCLPVLQTVLTEQVMWGNGTRFRKGEVQGYNE